MRNARPIAFVAEVHADTIVWLVPRSWNSIETPDEIEFTMDMGTVLGRMPLTPLST
jgi:hypothetical protein